MTTKKKGMAEVTEAVLYLRVSTSEQQVSGLGLEVQESRCRGYCEAQGWSVSGVYVDAGLSAKSLNRPELEQALAALRPGRVLVALKMDRLTRSVTDLAPLADRIAAAGAEWACVQEHYDTSTATGRLMLRMIVELSQWEREVISERTAAALGAKRARGERLGTTPLGYRPDLTEDPEGMATVQRARALRAAGASYREIASTLAEEGHRTKRGGAWAPQTVKLLTQPRYVETGNCH